MGVATLGSCPSRDSWSESQLMLLLAFCFGNSSLCLGQAARTIAHTNRSPHDEDMADHVELMTNQCESTKIDNESTTNP